MSHSPRAWLITGCSTGFGRALAEALIARGEHLVATARKPGSLADLVAGHDNARALKLDVTVSADVEAVTSEVERAGGVDVLVNNAGHGYPTAIEEGDEEGYRAQFEADVFGLFAMTKAVLPGTRERGSGHIVNIASAGGLVGNPGSGYDAATRFGVAGFPEGQAPGGATTSAALTSAPDHSVAAGHVTGPSFVVATLTEPGCRVLRAGH